MKKGYKLKKWRRSKERKTICVGINEKKSFTLKKNLKYKMEKEEKKLKIYLKFLS